MALFEYRALVGQSAPFRTVEAEDENQAKRKAQEDCKAKDAVFLSKTLRQLRLFQSTPPRRYKQAACA